MLLFPCSRLKQQISLGLCLYGLPWLRHISLAQPYQLRQPASSAALCFELSSCLDWSSGLTSLEGPPAKHACSVKTVTRGFCLPGMQAEHDTALVCTGPPRHDRSGSPGLWHGANPPHSRPVCPLPPCQLLLSPPAGHLQSMPSRGHVLWR